MNEKLTLQYLIEALTKRHQMDPKDADAFVKAFFELIRRALERDKYIKVKGLGTFKRVETDSRGSDEEESEERTGTQGRSRITFTPDVAMRDSINKPFAHFETVILNEHTHFEDMDEEEERLSDESIEQTSPDDASLTEPETPVSEENHEENHLSDVQGTEEEKLPVVDKEESQNADIPQIESSVEADDASQSETHEEPVSQEAEKKEVVPEVVPATEHGSQSLSEIPLDSSDKKIQKEERSKLPWCMYATILLVGVLIGGGIIWALLSGRRYIPEALLRELISEKKVNNAILLPKSTEKKETLDTLAAMETVQADSVGRQKPVHVTLPTVSSAAPVVKAPAPVKDEKPQAVKRETLADTMEYTITGTMDTYTLQNGESLVKVALKYYGNKKLWPYIVRHNRKVIKNPDNVPVGTVLQIPKLSPKN